MRPIWEDMKLLEDSRALLYEENIQFLLCNHGTCIRAATGA